MEQETVLNVHNLNVTIDGNKILNDLNFFVKKGDVLAIVGPNGAGKSVLFRTLLGLFPYSGSIVWGQGLKTNYIPQKFYIDKDLPLTVKEFLEFKNNNLNTIVRSLISVGISDDSHDGHAEHYIREHLLPHRLSLLSGGQLQRVLIAWSVIDNPDILLFDGGEETIYNLIEKLRVERNMTVLLISHDLNIVYRYANNVICLNKKMICFGQPNLVLDPTALSQLYGGTVGFYKHEHSHE